MLPERPLTGEPLALDLVNTEWIWGRKVYDLLASEEGTRAWLDERELPYDETQTLLWDLRAHLLHTRAALRGVLETPHDSGPRDRLNAVLTRGKTVYFLGEHGPEETVEVDEAWHPSWLAAKDLFMMLHTTPERLKKCANSQCVLHFFDTSPKNARRWHDMKICGNRAKAARHYHKNRG